MQLQIETSSSCNARCVFCVYPQSKRSKQFMSMELFKKVIDEAATIPQIELITLTGLGETLLDPEIVNRIRYIRSLMPDMVVDLFTNGSPLTRALIDNLIGAGLSRLFISLNATSAEKRKAITGLDDYERVCEMAHYAIDKAEGRMLVVVKAVGDKGLMEIDDHDRFVKEWGGYWDKGGHANLHLEGNWAGNLWPLRITPHDACPRALNQLMVLADGRMTPCCFDGLGQEILGDLNTQTIREVYNDGRALEIRAAHHEGRRGDIGICRNCSGI